ncbi:hypothetical protein JIX56_45660 [Streptomyces sp. CA-210063]|uniref:hypothetical protein n=1 Tax=Streptomyces sp. CA-210063 TaxID=2801029 RepID=UPI00214D0848|nr:hypothetical protein [Streptomyces sp. CA-210063]UUU36526.1 hypothetical protein JIX56_45660 [Streptomyces sp. CA-210063]
MRDFTGPIPAVRRPAPWFDATSSRPCSGRPTTGGRTGYGPARPWQYVLLTATAHGLRTSLLHQAMEWPDLRAAMALPRHKRCHPHVLIRFGYGPDGHRTPRASANPAAGAVTEPEPEPEPEPRISRRGAGRTG